MADVLVNGISMASRNWWIDVAADIGGMATPRYQTVPLHRQRGVVVAGLGTFAPRQLTLRGRMLTSANTAQARQTAEDELKDLLGGGLVTIEESNGTTPVRQIDAYLDGDPVFERFGHPQLAVASTVTARFLCPDVDWMASAGSALALVSGVAKAVPLGTAPSIPIVRIMGSATNPQIVVKSPSGGGVAQVVFTITLGANDWLDVDCERGVVEKVVAGTRSTAADTINTSGWTTFPFAIDPAWGDYKAALWPSITIVGAAGELLYTKRYR